MRERTVFVPVHLLASGPVAGGPGGCYSVFENGSVSAEPQRFSDSWERSSEITKVSIQRFMRSFRDPARRYLRFGFGRACPGSGLRTRLASRSLKHFHIAERWWQRNELLGHTCGVLVQ